MKYAKAFALPIALALVLLVNVYASAATGSGSIWTTNGDCGSESQDVNHFAVGDTVYINGANFSPGDHQWIITGKPGGASSDPNQIVDQGVVTVGSSGSFCINAYVVQPGDEGEYQVKVGNKGDNYRVKSVHPTKTPTLTKTPTSTNPPTQTETFTATNTSVPTDTSTPTNTQVATNTPSATATSTFTPTATNTNGGPTNTPTSTATNTSSVPTNTPKNPTNTPTNTSVVQVTNTPFVPTATFTSVPTIIVVFQPTTTPELGNPYCGMQVVVVDPDRNEVRLALDWRDGIAVGDWGDGTSMTIPIQKSGVFFDSHTYPADMDDVTILVLVSDGAKPYFTCVVDVPLVAPTPTPIPTATPVCAVVCQPLPPCVTCQGNTQTNTGQGDFWPGVSNQILLPILCLALLIIIFLAMIFGALAGGNRR